MSALKCDTSVLKGTISTGLKNVCSQLDSAASTAAGLPVLEGCEAISGISSQIEAVSEDVNQVNANVIAAANELEQTENGIFSLIANTFSNLFSNLFNKENIEQPVNNENETQQLFGTLFNQQDNELMQTMLDNSVKNALAEKYGVETTDANGKQKPTSVILNEIREQAEGTPDAEWVNGVTNLVQNNPLAKSDIEKYEAEIISNLLPKNNSDIAHRGYGDKENSAEAFIKAGEAGFWGCETDVRFDADGNLVCSHGEVGKGENPTTFEEYLDICKKYGMTAIIDLKYEVGDEEKFNQLSPEVLKIIEEKGMMDSCVLQTNMPKDIANIRANSDDARIWYLTDNTSKETVDLVIENNIECVNIKNGDNNSEQIKKLMDNEIDVCVWNVQTDGKKEYLLNKNATYIMSDNVLGITPYELGEEDFNDIKGNYKTTNTVNYYTNLGNINTTTTNVENIYTRTRTTTQVTTIGQYNGEILIAPKGRIQYLRADGVTVEESWCPLQYLDTVLGNLYEFEGNKIVEGQYIKDLEPWVRDDGVKMLGPYVMVATDVISRRTYGIDDDLTAYEGGTYDYGDIVETTLGKGIVMDLCSQARTYRINNGEMYTNLEVYTDWLEPEYKNMVYADGYIPKNYANNPLLEQNNNSTNTKNEETTTGSNSTGTTTTKTNSVGSIPTRTTTTGTTSTVTTTTRTNSVETISTRTATGSNSTGTTTTRTNSVGTIPTRTTISANTTNKEDTEIKTPSKDKTPSDTSKDTTTSETGTSKPSTSKPSTSKPSTPKPSIPEVEIPIVDCTPEAILQAAQNYEEATSHSEYILDILHESGYFTEEQMSLYEDYNLNQVREKLEELGWERTNDQSKLQIGDIVFTQNMYGEQAVQIYSGENKWYILGEKEAQILEENWEENLLWFAYRPAKL